MCKPWVNNPNGSLRDKFSGVASNILSASSALNMYPEPIDNDGGRGYLADVDAWAKHAMEHIHAAFDDLQKLASECTLMESKMKFPERYNKKRT